jgi:hypothetical protein
MRATRASESPWPMIVRDPNAKWSSRSSIQMKCSLKAGLCRRRSSMRAVGMAQMVAVVIAVAPWEKVTPSGFSPKTALPFGTRRRRRRPPAQPPRAVRGSLTKS